MYFYIYSKEQERKEGNLRVIRPGGQEIKYTECNVNGHSKYIDSIIVFKTTLKEFENV